MTEKRRGTGASSRRGLRRLLAGLEVGAFKAGGRIAPHLPRSVANTLADSLRRLLQRQMHDRRFMIERHMRRALGAEAPQAEVDRAVDEAFASYARYWLETFRLGGFDRRRIEDVFSVDGLDTLLHAISGDTGCIVALPHLGQWEIAGAWVGLQGWRLTTVVEELEPAELYRWFVDLRERKFGMNVYSASDRTALRKLVTDVTAGDVVALLADRDLGGRGPEVTFFGEKTTLPAGPATLSIQTGAPLLPAAVYEIGDWKYEAVVRPALPIPTGGSKADRVAAMTQDLAYEIEGLIRRAPAQWHLLQPNWPSDREALARHRAERGIPA
ncbi:MAG: phosphatidylinositol mannoside acyltransferase [Acidimicrobiia bacterium]|nr:phosphatidylinositol mannoside acyltransferase [Acidimicrobiia bacterium]